MTVLTDKIKLAKDILGMNNAELSRELGKSRQYITKMLNNPQTERTQKIVIQEIDELLGQGKDKVIDELNQELNELRKLHELNTEKYVDACMELSTSIKELHQIKAQNKVLFIVVIALFVVGLIGWGV